jgi:hypothetical protein
MRTPVAVESAWPEFLVSPRLSKFVRRRDEFEALPIQVGAGGYGTVFEAREQSSGLMFVEKQMNRVTRKNVCARWKFNALFNTRQSLDFTQSLQTTKASRCMQSIARTSG